jgi:7,8-dihydro-6-hydroxymethylpterin-pyrophosphokinase
VSLYKRGDVWHYDFQHKGERLRGSTGQRTKQKAQRWLEKNRDDIKLGTTARRTTHTLGEAADKWFLNVVVGQKSELTTAMRLKILFRHIDRHMAVTDVGPREITDAILSRRQEPIRGSRKGEPKLPSPSTVNRDIIDVLRPILGYAADSLEEPVKRFKWARLRLEEPKGRTRNFTPDELAKWRAEMPEWHRDTFDFIQRYGVRLNEAFFPPSAVNVEACEITLYDTKNGSDHILTVLAADMPALAARKARAEEAGLDTIWYRDIGGRLHPSNWRAFQMMSWRALQRAGIQNARPVHDLRHHAATTLMRETGNLKLVQALLNHRDIASSARYAHTNKDDLRRALEQTYVTKSTTATAPQNATAKQDKG